MNIFVNITPFVINRDKLNTPLNWSRIRKLEILCVLIKSVSWVQNPYEVYYIIKDSYMHVVIIQLALIHHVVYARVDAEEEA